MVTSMQPLPEFAVNCSTVELVMSKPVFNSLPTHVVGVGLFQRVLSQIIVIWTKTNLDIHIIYFDYFFTAVGEIKSSTLSLILKY